MERDVDSYVAALVVAFREVRRVLRDDGLVWLNLGDSFASGEVGRHDKLDPNEFTTVGEKWDGKVRRQHRPNTGLGPKQLLMVPHRVALALQADGWILRDALIWSKADMTEDLDIDGGVMPGSQRDRCTFAYEMLFMLARRPRYYFDRDALRSNSGALLRNVWRINTSRSQVSHFALMPPEMARRCVLLATSEKGCCPHCSAPWRRVTESIRKPTRPGTGSKIISNGVHIDRDIAGHHDPRRHVSETTTVGCEPSCKCPAHVPVPCTVADFFAGAGTTVMVATALGRRAVGCDLSHDYLTMARDRIDRPHRRAPRPASADGDDMPLFRREDL